MSRKVLNSLLQEGPLHIQGQPNRLGHGYCTPPSTTDTERSAPPQAAPPARSFKHFCHSCSEERGAEGTARKSRHHAQSHWSWAHRPLAFVNKAFESVRFDFPDYYKSDTGLWQKSWKTQISTYMQKKKRYPEFHRERTALDTFCHTSFLKDILTDRHMVRVIFQYISESCFYYSILCADNFHMRIISHILGPEINQTTSDPGPNQNRNPKRKPKKTSPHPTNRKQKLSGHRVRMKNRADEDMWLMLPHSQ